MASANLNKRNRPPIRCSSSFANKWDNHPDLVIKVHAVVTPGTYLVFLSNRKLQSLDDAPKWSTTEPVEVEVPEGEDRVRCTLERPPETHDLHRKNFRVVVAGKDEEGKVLQVFPPKFVDSLLETEQ